MVMADVFAVVFGLVGLGLALPAFWVVAAALTPRWMAQAQQRCTQTPLKSLFLGLVAAPLLLTPGFALGSQGAGGARLLGVMWVGCVLGLALVGAGGLAGRIGSTLRRPTAPSAPWQDLVRGGVALELACLVPFVGWFVLTPAVLTSGLGAGLLALFRRLPLPAEVSPEAQVAA